jgi:hypothetical protein
MIVSITPEEFGEISDGQLLHYLEIWLDGKRQSNVVKADDRRGLLRFLKRDATGRIVRDDDNKAVTEIVTGTVEIKLSQSAPEQVKTLYRDLRAMEAGQ